MSKEPKEDKVKIELSQDTAAWLRKVLENMQVNGSAQQVRKLLAYSDDVLAQLPGGEDEKG